MAEPPSSTPTLSPEDRIKKPISTISTNKNKFPEIPIEIVSDEEMGLAHWLPLALLSPPPLSFKKM